MLSVDGRTYMFLAPWMAIWPGVALAVTVYGVNMFGDAVRDILDPRLRGDAGRYGLRAKRAMAQTEGDRNDGDAHVTEPPEPAGVKGGDRKNN